MAQQLLHRAQVAAGLQQVARAAVAQHVRVHVRGQPGLEGEGLQARAHLAGGQPRAAPADEQRGLVRPGEARPHLEPGAQRGQGRGAHRDTAPLGALAQHLGRGVGGVDPARGAGPCPGVEPDEFAHAQPAAVEQLDDAVVARAQGGVAALRRVRRQGDRLVHRQRLGQRPRRLGRADAVHGVERDQALPAPPAVQPAPGGERDGDAARAQPALAQLRREAAHVVRLHLAQRHRPGRRAVLEPAQRVAVHRHRARRQPPLDDEVLEVARELGVVHGAGRRRDSAALATSPMRIRNSVPMSAL